MGVRSTAGKAVLLGIVFAVAASLAVPGAKAASKEGKAVFAVG